MIDGGLKALGRLLGLSKQNAGDALTSERVARSVLTRRSFLAASSALAAGSVFVFPTKLVARVAGELYVGLHTADPGPLGLAEATYATYARVAVARSEREWKVDGGRVSNEHSITFPMSTDYDCEPISHVSFSDHRGNVMCAAELTAPLMMWPGLSPVFEPHTIMQS